MIIDLFLGLLLVVLAVPLLTGYAAYSHGRSFWLWFALGFFLPVVSLAVLILLLAFQHREPGDYLVSDAHAILDDAARRAAQRAENRAVR